ncbi:MAG: hypothetical protein WCL13_02265 [bacterium]
MGNLQFVDRSNVGGFLRSSVPFNNGVGAEYWSHSVQDEHRRVRENDEDRKFIPDEDFLISGLDGEPLMSSWDLVGDKDVSGQRDGAIHVAVDNEPDDQAADDFLAAAEEQDILADSASEEDKMFDTPENNPVLYRDMYPRLQTTDNIFHGMTRQNVVLKTKLRAKPNAKKRFCDYLKRMRQTIRTAHFNRAVAEAELALVLQQM